VAADSNDPFVPKSPLGKEARSLSDQAWTRARAHELTEEQLQDIIGQLKSLAEREPEEFEREGIQASAANLRDLFQLVEYQEQDAELARISNSEPVRRAEEIAAQAAPIFKPDSETPHERAERRERIQKALSGVSELYWQATWEQQQVLQELVDTLRWARDAIDGNATPT
jgi:hypothetical protein